MKKIKKILAVVLALCLSLACFALVACGDDPKPGERTVKSVKVTTTPAKVEYNVGDTVDFSDGVITVTYSDDTTETKKFTDEGVEVSEVNTTINGDDDSEEKTVTVRFGGKRATFTVTVSHAMLTVTFDHGYAGSTAGTEKVRKDAKLAKPTDPTRDGHTFEGWYDDAACTVVHNFDVAVTDNITVYAKWLETGATYFDVQFDYNYSGAANPAAIKVKSGEKVAKYGIDPTRDGYTFEGWCSDAAGKNAFAFDTATITAATTIYAKWSRTSAGVSEYVFEAEDTDLTGKSGPGLSGKAPGTAMIQFSNKLGASNDRFIGYQYDETCTLEFHIVSDMAVSDAKIVLRLSAEMRDYNMGPDNYYIMLNGNLISYSEIKFENVPKSGSDDVGEVNALPFADFVILENASLKEGLNTIQLQTANDHPLEGTTVLSDAPLIDCLKITTSAVLSWSAANGLPKKDNY